MQSELPLYEEIVTTERLRVLQVNPIMGSFDLAHMQRIHTYLFQDVYPFAGQIRTENIAKDSLLFADSRFITPDGERLAKELRSNDYLRSTSLDQFGTKDADLMADRNVLHPFQEGNGRTTREFIRSLAKEAGFDLDWRRVVPERVFEASVKSKNDPRELAVVIKECTPPARGRERTMDAPDKSRVVDKGYER